MRNALLAAAIALCACNAGPGSLSIQLISDMTPGLDLDAADIALRHDDGRHVGDPIHAVLDVRSSLGRPTRLAFFGDLPSGGYFAEVTLTRVGVVVQARTLLVRVEGATVRTLLMTRSCGGIDCGGTCYAGRCSDTPCAEESPSQCLFTPDCTADEQCSSGGIACAPARCSAAGACFVAADDTLCAASETCDAQAGCVAIHPTCDWTSPTFSPPVIAIDMPFRESSLTLSHDGLDAYFTEEFAPMARAYVAHRASLDAAFGTPVIYDELHDAASIEGGFTFRRDGLEVFFTRQPYDLSELADVYRATRARRTDPFGTPVLDDVISTPDYEFDTFLEGDGLTLWLERQTTTGGADVLRAHRARRELPFESPVPVRGLSSPSRVESNPTLPDDASFVLYATDGALLDVAYAPMVDGTPQDEITIDALNSAAEDFEPFVRLDGCEVLFVSYRAGDGGGAIYRSQVTP